MIYRIQCLQAPLSISDGKLSGSADIAESCWGRPCCTVATVNNQLIVLYNFYCCTASQATWKALSDNVTNVRRLLTTKPRSTRTDSPKDSPDKADPEFIHASQYITASNHAVSIIHNTRRPVARN